MSPLDLFLLNAVLLPIVGCGIVSQISGKYQATENQAQLTLWTMLGIHAVGALTIGIAGIIPVSIPAVPILLDGGFIAGDGGVTQSVVGQSLPTIQPGMVAAVVVAGGVVFQIIRLLISFWHIAAIAARSQRVSADVFDTPELVPPFSWRDRDVILPQFLRTVLDDRDIELITAHERCHIQRRDSRWFLVLAAIDALFWYNPFIRQQTKSCRHAAENAVDTAVLTQYPNERKRYAACLVLVLKQSTRGGSAAVPAAIGSPHLKETRMRIDHILRRTSPNAAPRRAALSAIFGGLALAHGGVALALIQPDRVFDRMPTEGRISSCFGERKHPITKKITMHQGMDIAAPQGTPVVSPTSGRVTFAGARGGYGNFIEIAHANGMTTRYGQLHEIKVAVGDTVSAYSTIGTVGSTGRSTGPHLHFEVLDAGERIDPATVLPDTDC